MKDPGMTGNGFLDSEEILSAQFENSPDIILIVDRECRVLKTNRALSRDSGAEEQAGGDVRDRLPAEYQDAAREALMKCFETGNSVCLEHPVSNDVWLQSRVVPFKQGGVVTHGMIISTDITERKRTEQALRESEKKLSDIASHIGEGLYVLDRTGRISFMNPVAEELLGWTMDELKNKNVHDIFHYCREDGSSLSFQDCPILRVLDSGSRFVSSDEVFVRKNGTVFPVSVIASPIIEDGKKVAAVTAFRDITERKRLEQQLSRVQKLESVGVLAGGIAHDFNNLLQAILGHISLATMFIDPAHKAKEQLAKAEAATELAKDLSFRLLTFSKGGEPLKKITSLTALLREAVDLSLRGTNISREFHLDEDLHRVQIDEGQIRQVVKNLIINAREAMPDRGVIKIAAENVSLTEIEGLPVNEGEYVHVSVRDSGVGISSGKIHKIFDPYFTTKALGSEKGMGLGLSICHSIIKKHDGFITVDSDLGKGSTFHLYLPSAERPSSKVRGPTKKTAGRKRILFMDDEPRVRDIVSDIIRHLGYDVETAEKGEAAVGLYAQSVADGDPFDLVMLDLTVQGGMGGETAMKKLREIDPAIMGVISSGYADDPVLRGFRERGFAGAIAKPYRLEELRELLNRIFS